MALDPVISAKQLCLLVDAHQQDHAVVLLDCRAGARARADYAAGHLPGAIFADLEADLAAPTGTPERGGRHPLPAPSAFAAQLGRWGITPSTHVVAYDDQGGANAAARLWWMLRSLGHEQVQVLDGGFQAALAAGYELSAAPVQPVLEAPYPRATYTWPTANIDDVEELRKSPDHRVLDVRAGFRFRGESEPIDPVAGHIPGAHNLPFSENLTEGHFKSAEALRTLYREFLAGTPQEHLVVHCGSGVTACHTLLALERAGLHGARLYVGSWSEWCRNPERERAP